MGSTSSRRDEHWVRYRNVMTTVRRGFRYDRGNSKLEVVVDGKVVAKFNDISPSLTLDSALPVASGGTGLATLTNHGV